MAKTAVRLLLTLSLAEAGQSNTLLFRGQSLSLHSVTPSQLRHELPKPATQQQQTSVVHHELPKPISAPPQGLPHGGAPAQRRTKQPEQAPPSPDSRNQLPKPVSQAKYDEMQAQGHRVFGQAFILTIVVLSVGVAMVSSTDLFVSMHTWLVLDDLVTNFIGVAWFFTADSYIEYLGLTGVNAAMVYCIGCLLVLFLQKIIKSSVMAEGSENEEVITAFAGPTVVWLNAGFVNIVLENFKKNLFYLALVLGALAIWYLLLGIVYHQLVSRVIGTGQWTDQIEHEMGGGAIAFGFIILINALIKDMLGHEGPLVTVLVMVVLTFLLWIAAIGLHLWLDAKTEEVRAMNGTFNSSKYWKVRGLMAFSAFVRKVPEWALVSCIADAVMLLFGFHNTFDNDSTESIQAKLITAFVSSVFGCLIIALCAYTTVRNKDPLLGKTLVRLGGFMMGAAWGDYSETVIHMSVEGSGYGGHSFLAKLAITIFISANVFPVYYFYLKPTIMEKTDPQPVVVEKPVV